MLRKLLPTIGDVLPCLARLPVMDGESDLPRLFRAGEVFEQSLFARRLERHTERGGGTVQVPDADENYSRGSMSCFMP